MSNNYRFTPSIRVRKHPRAIFADAAILPATLIRSQELHTSQVRAGIGALVRCNISLSFGARDVVHFFSAGHSFDNCRNWSDETVALIIPILLPLASFRSMGHAVIETFYVSQT